MKLKKYFLLALVFILSQNLSAQIKNLDDFIINTEELRMLTQRIAKNYIMSGVLANNPKIKKDLNDDMARFNEIIINLTENAPNEEIEIELQKLSLSSMLINKILQKKYDIAAAAKVINYAEKMEHEVTGIGDMVAKSTSQKTVRLLRLSSKGEMLSQKLLLYYIANYVKIRNKEVPERFESSKTELYEVIKLLNEQAVKDPDLKTDEGIALYLEMISDAYSKVRKTLTLKSKVHPLTANMIVNQMSDNFNLLTNIFYQKFN